MPLLEIRDLTKSFAAPDGSRLAVLDVPSFDLGEGEQAALRGMSGSGKTTLLNCIAGILPPDGGTIRIGDHVMHADAPAPDEIQASDRERSLTGGARSIVAFVRIALHIGRWLRYSLRTGAAEAKRDALRARSIGYVFQSFNLLQGLTALENVALGMAFGGSEANPAARAKELLGRVGLGDRLHYRPRQLSIGQQQRVAVARALAAKPALVLADGGIL